MRNALRISATLCVIWGVLLVALPWTSGQVLLVGIMLVGLAFALAVLAEI